METVPKSLQINEIPAEKTFSNEKDEQFSEKLKNLLENVDTDYQQSIL